MAAKSVRQPAEKTKATDRASKAIIAFHADPDEVAEGYVMGRLPADAVQDFEQHLAPCSRVRGNGGGRSGVRGRDSRNRWS